MKLETVGGRPDRVTPAMAFRQALINFVEQPRLDMIQLAEELEISEATLHSWTGSREQLLADVLTYYSDIAFDQAARDTADQEGLDRVVSIGRIYIGLVVTFEPLRIFFRNESTLALRILTERGGTVESGVVERITEVLRYEQDEHGMVLRAPADVLANAMTRTIEGFIYNDPLADIEPEVDQAVVILQLLLE